jgi:carboxyl-terminal processing protease
MKTLLMVLHGFVALSAVAPATGCAVEDPPSKEIDCSTTAQNAVVYQLMKDAYLWYDKVPEVAYAGYPSPESLLQDLVYASLDRWSYINTKSANDAYYEEGRSLGMGFRLAYDAEGDVRLSFVHSASPAGDAGLRRGDKALAINGKTVEEIDQADLWTDVLGPEEEGVEVVFTMERPDGAVDVTLTKRWYTLTSVGQPRFFSVGSKTVGYLFFGRFIEPAAAELDDAFATLAQRQVDELVLDLRYNGGGRLNVAQHLASLVHQPAELDAELARLVYNDRHSDWDERMVFEGVESSSKLARLIVITSPGTASASEMLVNGLRPYIDVKLVGTTTHGKPVGMATWEYCDKVILPISFRVLNAGGEGDYYDGLPPSCWAEDQIQVELGDPAEASLAEALYIVEHGVCSNGVPPGSGAGERHKPPRRPVPMHGFRREVGAF